MQVIDLPDTAAAQYSANRKAGYYYVRFEGRDLIAEYRPGQGFYLCGVEGAYHEDCFEVVGLFPIESGDA